MGQFPLAQAEHRLQRLDPLVEYFFILHEHVNLLIRFQRVACPRAKNPDFQQTIQKTHRLLLLITRDYIQNLRGHLRMIPELYLHLWRQRHVANYDGSEAADAFRFRHALLNVKYEMIKTVWEIAFGKVERLRNESNF